MPANDGGESAAGRIVQRRIVWRATIPFMRRIGDRQWSVQVDGLHRGLAHVLAIREIADLPVYGDWIPEPLTPSPPPMRFRPSAHVRAAAAQAWPAWWRIVVAQTAAHHRESAVTPEPPLHGLSALWTADPPTFHSLDPAPELRHLVASTWDSLSPWFRDIEAAGEQMPHDWIYELIAAADAHAGHPIRDFNLRLDVLPVAGTRRWTLTNDPARGLFRALVTIDLLTEPTRHRDWLLDLLASLD